MANPAWPSAGHWNRLLTDPATGLPLLNTNYSVFMPDGSTPVSIYTDKTRATARPQPLTTDAAGNAGFFADPFSGLVLAANAGTQVIDVLPDVADLLGTNVLSDGGSHTTYLFSGADNLKDLGFLAGTGAGVNLVATIPNNLPKNWSCRVLHEGGQGYIQFVAASGATIHANKVTSTTAIYHPGPWAWTDLTCRFNGSGSQADVVISNGLTAAP